MTKLIVCFEYKFCKISYIYIYRLIDGEKDNIFVVTRREYEYPRCNYDHKTFTILDIDCTSSAYGIENKLEGDERGSFFSILWLGGLSYDTPQY